MAVINSGPFSGISGTFIHGNGINDASFCYAGTTADAYPAAGAAGDLQFGFFAGILVITNDSANDACYAFPALYSQTPANAGDSGVIKGNSTVVIGPLANKNGIRFRSRSSGSAATIIISAI